MVNGPFSFDAKIVADDSGSVSPSETLDQTKEKYRTRKPRADKGRSRGQIQQEQIQKAAMEVDAMLTPENMEAVVCLPADMGLAITGRDLWLLEEKEVKALSVSAATTGKYFWQHDPKWLALAIFAMNFGMVYGTRLVKNFREVKKEKLDKLRSQNKRYGTEPKQEADIEKNVLKTGDAPESFKVEPLG